MITRLRMKRWKSHEDTQLQFGKGSNLLIGSMGSGKSSAMDAVSFALFGSFPALKSRKVKIEELVMQRPRKHATAEIELEFDYGGKNYRVIRSAGGKATTSAQLFGDGKLLEAQTSRVTELIEGILHVDYDLFSRIIYAEQNRIDYLLALQKGERKRQIDDLLGISRFEQVRANAGTAMNRLEAEISELRSFLQGAGGEGLKKQVEEARVEAKRMHEELRHGQHSLSENHAKLREARGLLLKLEHAEQAYLKAEREIAAAESLLREKERELAASGAADEAEYGRLKHEHQQMEKALAEHRKRLTAISEGLAAEATELRFLREEEQRLRKSIGERDAIKLKLGEIGSAVELKRKLGALEVMLQQEQAALSQLEERKRQLSESVAALHSAGARCPVCDAELDEGRKAHLGEERKRHIAEIGERISAGTHSLKGLQAEALSMRALAEEAGMLESKLGGFAGTGAELGKTRERIFAVEGSSREREGERAEVAEMAVKLEGKVREGGGRLQLMERARKLEGEVAALSGQLNSLSGKLKMMEYKPAELSGKRELLLQLERQGAALGSEISALSAGISERNRTNLQLQKKLEELQSKEKGVERLQEKAAKLAQFQEAVMETQAALREELVDAMNSAMNALWGSIYPYGDYSRLRLNATEEDYALELCTSGDEWVAVEGCSGGERSCAALTLRIAFATVLTPGLSWLILDEPTHNLDAQAVQLLNRALHDEIPKVVEQTFIITHDEALKEGASSKVFYFERDKANSEKTVVEELSA